MEPEDLDLADHVAQLAGSGEGTGVLAQRLPDRDQLGEQLGGGFVAALIAVAGRQQALADQAEGPAIGLLRIALPQARGAIREPLVEVGEQFAERRVRPDDALRERQAARQHAHALGQEPEALVAHQLERLARDVGGDVRIAVAVAADPGAEGEQRRDLDLGAGIDGGDRRLQIAVDDRHLVGERAEEVDESRPDLVEDRRRHGAQLVGAPELLHRPEQPASREVDPRRRQRAAVEVAEDGEDPGELAEGRPPARLGRMRGEHEPDLGGRE